MVSVLSNIGFGLFWSRCYEIDLQGISRDALAAREWEAAVKSELASLAKSEVAQSVEECPMPQDTDVISTQWILVAKADSRLKARLVE